MEERFESPGTAFMRVKRNDKYENVRVEDMSRDEFAVRFNEDSAGFLDYLADKIRWHEDILGKLGFEKEAR